MSKAASAKHMRKSQSTAEQHGRLALSGCFGFAAMPVCLQLTGS